MLLSGQSEIWVTLFENIIYCNYLPVFNYSGHRFINPLWNKAKIGLIRRCFTTVGLLTDVLIEVS